MKWSWDASAATSTNIATSYRASDPVSARYCAHDCVQSRPDPPNSCSHSFGGSLAAMKAPKLGAVAIKAAVEQAGIPAEYVQEVYFGNVCSVNLPHILSFLLPDVLSFLVATRRFDCVAWCGHAVLSCGESRHGCSWACEEMLGTLSACLLGRVSLRSRRLSNLLFLLSRSLSLALSLSLSLSLPPPPLPPPLSLSLFLSF